MRLAGVVGKELFVRAVDVLLRRFPRLGLMMGEVFGARHPTEGSDCIFDLRRVLVVGDRACFELIEEIGGVNRHTQTLATLWNEGARILRIEDRDERAHAMNPIFEQISQVVNDFRSRSATPTSSSKTIV